VSRTYVALDIETTGLSPDKDAIIEIGAVRFHPGGEVSATWSSLVNPDRPLPFRIQQLTGITQADLAGAPSLFQVLPALSRFVGDATIVGHNVGFDLDFLNRHGALVTNPRIDTFELASILMPHADRYNLGRLAEELGISFPTRHRALEDAMATKELFLAMVERASQLDLETLREINRLAARTPWPLKAVFRDAEARRARTAFTSSIGQQLRAKGEFRDDALGLFFQDREEVEPLRPTARLQPLDVEALAAMLEPGGAIAQRFPGYEHRPQQVEMLRAVTEAFNRGVFLLVEAGTGTGKSLAYLLPAIHFAVANGRRVVISTNTINLQDQLFTKDIPDLQRLLPLQFRATILKGRTNYLCRRRLDAFRRRNDLSEDEVRLLAKILAWLPSTTTGDVAELTLIGPERAAWSRVCADAESCRPDTCAYTRGRRCFFYRARHLAESAHLIVVNHALLLSDMALENRVLPEHRYLIIDEVHHLEARATEQLGFEVGQAAILGLLNQLCQSTGLGRRSGFLAELAGAIAAVQELPPALRRKMADRIEAVQDDVQQAENRVYPLFNALSACLDELVDQPSPSGYDLHIRLTGGVRVQPAWVAVEMAWDNLAVLLEKIHHGLDRLLVALGEGDESPLPNHDDWVGELASYRRRVGDLLEQMSAILARPDPNGIYWVSLNPRDNSISLHAAPLHVGELLDKYLFSNKECVILTSATIQADEGFRFIKNRLGLWDAETLAVGSPFDYSRAALLYLPTDVPEPGQPYYQKTVETALIELCQATRGRTLVLFTSHSQLQTTYKSISRPLGEAGIGVLGQNLDGSRTQLLETFKADEGTVLLGTRSFWEGIDVVGEALSCLVIARLPFDVPTDPIFAARCETFENPFNEYAIPQTILRFRQGFGRLIRSKRDRGIVVVLDRRLQTKSYGRLFLEALPPVQVCRAPLKDLPRIAARWLEDQVIPHQSELL